MHQISELIKLCVGYCFLKIYFFCLYMCVCLCGNVHESAGVCGSLEVGPGN